ncbi:MAG: hypothetical protein EOO26_00875 [Comamonadaceae bacterium]|nr:MAG: hypothetical protein EOO26_00875 [Comamonadaceae bacterium]
MRIFGLVGLLLALVIVGLLVKKQFTTLAAPSLPPVPGATAAPAGTVKDQSQQIQQQYKQAIDAAMQQPRKMPDDN